MDIEQTLAQRGKTHGEYREHASATQDVMDVWKSHRNWDKLPAVIKETLHMIAHKVGRIVTGNPFLKDHYVDIQGYAKLVEQRITDTEDGIIPSVMAQFTSGREPEEIIAMAGLVSGLRSSWAHPMEEDFRVRYIGSNRMTMGRVGVCIGSTTTRSVDGIIQTRLQVRWDRGTYDELHHPYDLVFVAEVNAE